MQLEEKRWDCVIIGSGVAGLTASIYLARAGKSVLVLEKSKNIGGRGRTTEKEDSFLNLGPHALYTKGRSMEILQELGIYVKGGVVPTKGKIVQNGICYDIPATPYSLLTSPLLNWKAKKELLTFFINYKKIDTENLQHIPLRHWVEHKFKDKVAQHLILMLTRLSSYSNDPNRLSAGAALKQLQLGNAMYLHYGWQSMIRQLEEKAESFGVYFYREANVKMISGFSPQLKVYTNNEAVLAKNVLSTASPDETYAMLEGHESFSILRKLKERNPVRVACMDLVLSELPNPKINFAMDLENPFYFSNHSKIAKLSLQDYQIVHVMKYRNPSDTDDAKEIQNQLISFLGGIQPGWEEFVLYKRYLPTMIVSHNTVLAETNGFHGRPKPQVDQIPGLYVAGDWVGHEGMLVDAAFSSGRQAAEYIIEQYGAEGCVGNHD
ncbi:phytoene desaturase family protein [Ferdinandcohnia sp. Marseille-Q9671]